ncbi:MAG: hypothetical protein AAF050_15160 [Cyanobacteria bacterium J06649_5]
MPTQHSSKDSLSDDSFYTVLQSLDEIFGLTIPEALQDEGRLNADATLTRGEFATYLLEAYVSLATYAEDDSGEQLLTTNDPWTRSYENGIASLRDRLQVVVR